MLQPSSYTFYGISLRIDFLYIATRYLYTDRQRNDINEATM